MPDSVPRLTSGMVLDIMRIICEGNGKSLLDLSPKTLHSTLELMGRIVTEVASA